MAKVDRKIRIDRYEAQVAKYGEQELLNSFDALMRKVVARLRHRAAPRARPGRRNRRRSA